MRQVPGGTIDPGKLVSGLCRAAERSGAMIFENSAVEDIAFEEPVRLQVAGGQIFAKEVLLATNAMSLELSDLSGRGQPKFTLALATEPLSDAQIEELGLGSGKPFYTIDFPYLWGRLLRTGGIVFGCGLVHLKDWREFADIDIASGEAANLIARLEGRVRGLHPVLQNVKFAHRWGGPILIADGWRPVFTRHPRSPPCACPWRLQRARRRAVCVSRTLGRRGSVRPKSAAGLGFRRETRNQSERDRVTPFTTCCKAVFSNGEVALDDECTSVRPAEVCSGDSNTSSKSRCQSLVARNRVGRNP